MAEERKLGPYSEKQMDMLEKLEEMQDKIVTTLMDDEDITKDPDKLNITLNFMKEISTNIHKVANTTSKHDIGTSLVANAEERIESLRLLHTLEEDAFEEATDTDIYEVPEVMMVEPVPGQLLDGIDKPSLKEIMKVELTDDDDD